MKALPSSRPISARPEYVPPAWATGIASGLQRNTFILVFPLLTDSSAELFDLLKRSVAVV